MILISALTFILFCLTSLLGYAMLPKNLCFGAQNQVFQIGLGIVSTCNLILLVSCFSPVKPWMMALLCLFLIVYSLKNNLLRQWWHNSQSELPWLILASISGSIVTLMPLTWSDTHYYHYPLLKWISTFGILPGIGLIDPTFSHVAGWFALFSPFDTGIFSERLGTAGGALTLGLCMYTICRTPQIVAGLGALGILCLIGMSHNIFPSLSPDMMAQWIGLIAISLWIFPGSSRLVQERLILLLLVQGICIRVTLLPAFLMFGFWHLINQKGRFSSLWVLLLIIPATLSTLISSGCPLYPLSWFCTGEGISSAGAFAMQMHIREIVIWCDKVPSDVSGVLNWFPTWFYCQFNCIPMSLFFLGLVLLPYKNISAYELQAVIISIVMVLFFLSTAPAIRYGVIWFLIPLLIALQLRIKTPALVPIRIVSFLILILSACLYWHLPPSHDNLFRITSPIKPHDLWLVPPKALDFLNPVNPKEFLWNGIRINTPWIHHDAPRCSALTPPCATPESLNNLTPLGPDKISGFKHRIQ